MRIMLVEDNTPTRRILKHCLEKTGHRDVVEAGNGAEALQALAATPEIDLILLDLIMPVLDGAQFLKQLKGTPQAKIPVIMVTSETSVQRVSELLSAGVRGFLIKPFTPRDLVEKIAEVTGERGIFPLGAQPPSAAPPSAPAREKTV
jgi:two-component system, chemotaxis family, chemotaxis protein CheY